MGIFSKSVLKVESSLVHQSLEKFIQAYPTSELPLLKKLTVSVKDRIVKFFKFRHMKKYSSRLR